MGLLSFCNILTIRNIYTSLAKHKPQDGRFMKKILKDTRNKRKWINGDTSPTIPNITKGTADGKHSSNSRRTAVLNKMFMRYITDLMATGSNSSAFLGQGIEINRVMVSPDFNGVNVFWIAKGTENDDKIEEILTQNAGALRHELSQLRVMGVVPKINFVKDKKYAKIMEVDLRLSKADFGEDYVPVDLNYLFKTEPQLNITIPEEIRNQIKNLEEKEPLEEDTETLPPMRTDVLGLNHSEIMSRIEKSVKKSQALHRKNTEHTINSNNVTTINENPIIYENIKQQKEAFAEFLHKRQILQLKAKKKGVKYNPEYEFMRSEKLIYYNDDVAVDKFINEFKEDCDFLPEDDDKKTDK